MARIALGIQPTCLDVSPRETLHCPLCEKRRRATNSYFRPQIGRDYPLNLSISLSGGKETNKDSLSNGE